jgi:hypothetical protein
MALPRRLVPAAHHPARVASDETHAGRRSGERVVRGHSRRLLDGRERPQPRMGRQHSIAPVSHG